MIRDLVSIIIPTFNRELLLGETLNSVRKQTYPNWECIIVDDGSTDGTLEVINTFIESDVRFKFFQRNREPKGAPTCRNIGLENAVGQYIIFLDSDDLLAFDCLENRIKMAIANPNHDFWVFRTGQFNSTPGDSLSTWNILHKEIDDLQRFILSDAPWHTMGPLWIKRILIEIGGFDESALCWQDWELHIRVLLKTKNYWKSNDDYIDSYYRNDKLNKWNTISKNQNNIEHILFRINLFKEIYKKVTFLDHRKEIRITFSILFFRVIKELKNHHTKNEMKLLIRFLWKNKLYNNSELFLIWLYSINFNYPKLETAKKIVINRLFRILNEYVFFNKENSTFQS